MKRFALTLDLKDDAKLIEAYEAHHRAVWPEILQSLQQSGILHMEIYRVANRLFMVMDVADDFSFAKKDALDKSNPRVMAWEELMWKYQERLPFAKPDEKWVLMKKIFHHST